jgi:hypothetical protein
MLAKFPILLIFPLKSLPWTIRLMEQLSTLLLNVNNLHLNILNVTYWEFVLNSEV